VMTEGSERPWFDSNGKGPKFSFVDLENIRMGLDQFLDRKKVPSDRRKVFNIGRIIQNFHSDRVFVYSAIEARENEGPLIQALRYERGFIFKSTKLTINAGRRKQQGVDVLMAIEALKHAHSKNMVSCNIFSDDGDFLPLLEALVDHGVIVATICFGDPARSEVASSLRDASDVYYQIGSRILFNSMDDEFGWSSSGTQDKDSLLKDATEIESCFPELTGRVFKLRDNSFCLIGDRTPLENLSKNDLVDNIKFRSQVGLEEWFRITC
jgi:uncharacterized LabA/DUF88 family protein